MFPFPIPCSADAIYLILTSFDRPLKRSWSCEAEQWIMLRLPSVGVHNLGQWGPSTYGCCRRFYVIIGSDRSTRWILGKWMDIWKKAEGNRGRERGSDRKDAWGNVWAPLSPAFQSDPNRHMEHFYKFLEFSVLLGACLDVDGGTASRATNCIQNIHEISAILTRWCLDWMTPTQTHRWLFPSKHIFGFLISFKRGSLDETDVGMCLLRSESYTHTNWVLSPTPRKCF